MDRIDFIKSSALVGLGLGIWPQLLIGCKKDESWDINFSGKVIVVGAGAAGLMAGYFLKRFGIDFEILEAGNDIGGRTKKTDTFTDFPIDLGAEWLHTNPKIFGELFDKDGPDGSMDIIPYTPDTHSVYRDGELKQRNVRSLFYGEYKFKRSTWYDFLNSYVAPGFRSQIQLNTLVQSIDYTNQEVVVTDSNGVQHTAERVLVTIPSIQLKNGAIAWTPAPPSSFTSALSKTYMPAGMKVFFEFSERFYPDMTDLDGANDAENVYYDAAYKKDSNKNILGLFTIGPRADELNELGSDEAVIQNCLAELDTIFGGKASSSFVKAVVQNWTANPYIGGSYTFFNGKEKDIVPDLIEPFLGRVHFAGEALHLTNGATVHGAAMSGKQQIRKILSGN